MKPRLLSPSLSSGDFCRSLVEQAPEAIIYADIGRMIRFWNLSAERIFGFSAEEVLEKSLDMIIPKHLRQQHWDAFTRTMRTGATRYGAGEVLAVPALRKDGTLISVEFSISPFKDREGRMLGVAAILREMGKRREELSSLREEVAALRLQLARLQQSPLG
jgi:PAS domain S-box-containing protein